MWAGKSQVAPLKGHNFPQLELLGCVLLAQLIVEVTEAIGNELSVSGKIYFVSRILKYLCIG